ncbi:DgyrCDS265 [Dimorphilus gyrociliatus]|uniref:DgyrCDS265 n=1 Tax=Dimorphilus gyrociliatus TaxID=2664684 RepID=A0A7I8V412_9ANNE|nr:DgyrCDS265 [Dimorphilus gyrociliatus]
MSFSITMASLSALIANLVRSPAKVNSFVIGFIFTMVWPFLIVAVYPTLTEAFPFYRKWFIVTTPLSVFAAGFYQILTSICLNKKLYWTEGDFPVLLCISCHIIYGILLLLVVICMENFTDNRRTRIVWKRVCSCSNITCQTNEEITLDEKGDQNIICLRNVSMIYKKIGQRRVTALEDLNLRLTEGKIMVLFGHLNSGKSTLIRIISGRERPTSGKVIFHGYNWPSDIYKAIATIPERSDLYDWLTPYEILKYYARIRNVDIVDQHLLIENLLLELAIMDVAHSPIYELSKHDEKKLRISLALIGHSKVLLLDEPLLSLDLNGRRAVWQLLKKHKKGKIILVTTQFMNEANLFCDEKGILYRGKIKYWGTTDRLNDIFKLGYLIKFNLINDSEIDELHQVVEQNAPDAKLQARSQNYLCYRIPKSKIDQISLLFSKLESNSSHSNQDSSLLNKASWSSDRCQTSRLNSSWAEPNIEHMRDDLELKDFIRFAKRTIIEEARIPYSKTVAASFKIHNCSVTLITFESCISQILVEEANPFESRTRLSEEMKRISWARKTYHSTDDPGLLDDVLDGKGLIDSPPTMHTDGEMSEESGTSYQKFRHQVQKIWWNGERVPFFYAQIQRLIFLLLANIQSDFYPSLLSIGLLVIPVCFIWLGLIIETWYPINEPKSDSLKIDSFIYNSRPLLINSPKRLPNYLMDSLANASGIRLTKFFRYDITDIRNIKPQAYGLDFNDFLLSKNGSIRTEVALNFNDSEVHSPAIVHRALMGGLAGVITNGRLNSSNIIVNSHPWKEERSFFEDHAHLSATILVNFMIGLLPALSLKRLVQQNQIRIRLTLLGINRIVFWLMTLITDLSEIFLIFALFGFLITSFLDQNFTIQRFLLLGCKICSTLPFAYIVSFWIKNFGDAVFYCVALTTSLILPTFTLLLFLLWEREDLSLIVVAISSLLIPQFHISDQLAIYLSLKLDNVTFSYILFISLGPTIIHLIGFPFFIHLLELKRAFGMEWKRSLFITLGLKKVEVDATNDTQWDTEILDKDIKTEYMTVEKWRKYENRESTAAVVLNNVSKFEKDSYVDNISLYLKNSDIFGLIMPKTSKSTILFDIISGQSTIDFGEVFIDDILLYSGKTDLLPCNPNLLKKELLAVSPAKGAFIPCLTVISNIQLFARLTGYPNKNLREVTDFFLEVFSLKQQADTRACLLERDSKGSLNLCITLLQRPKILILDDPFFGMSNKTIKTMKSILKVFVEVGRMTVLMSARSLQEVESFCTKIAFMNNGRFFSIGTIDSLRKKHSRGKQLKFRLKENFTLEQSLQIQALILEIIPEAIISEQYSNFIVFNIPEDNGVNYGVLFKLLELSKSIIQYESFEVCQNSLGRMFCQFVYHSKQTEGVERRSGKKRNIVTNATKIIPAKDMLFKSISGIEPLNRRRLSSLTSELSFIGKSRKIYPKTLDSTV